MDAADQSLRHELRRARPSASGSAMASRDRSPRRRLRERKPLWSSTRAEADNGPLSSQLRELGLQVLLWPAVSVAVAETGALEEALEEYRRV